MKVKSLIEKGVSGSRDRSGGHGFDAVRLMDTYQVGALMVVEDEMLVGLIPSGIIPARLC